MGSWGEQTSRRTDRMPTMRAQVNTNKQSNPYTADDLVKNAMMVGVRIYPAQILELLVPDNGKNDLGTIRINELPLDDTPNSRYIPQRPRQPPAVTENSEALDGYRAMAEKGIDDAEAMAVRDLDDLGGPSVHRPTAGRVKNFMAEVRCPTTSFQGMKTSRNGILLPPGVAVHRFDPDNSPTVSRNPVAVASPQSGNAAVAQASKKSLPPHLRMKKKMETVLPSKPGPENGRSVEATKPVTTDISTASQTGEIAVSLPTPVTTKELLKDQSVETGSKNIQFSVTHVNTVKDDHASQRIGSKDDEVVIFWTGSCMTWVPEKGKDHMVMIDLKVINAAVGTEGQSLFVMTLPEVFVKKHNMSFYTLEITKGNLCVVKFVNHGNGREEGRYRLKFQDEMTATNFQDRAAVLQRVMGYLSDVAAANNDMGVEVVPVAEQNATPESKAVIEKMGSSAKDDENAPKESEISTDVITDAFNNLSLNKVKDADMYKANRQRVSYSAEELLEQRASARTPLGITDVKIPLNRHGKEPKNTSSTTQDVLEQDRQSKKSPTVHESAKLKDWITGKRPQPKTGGSFHISMPGLSEAVQYQKAAAATTKSSAQVGKGSSSENKPVNDIVDKNEIKADGAPENDMGGANDEAQMGSTANGTNPTTPKSTDAGASIGPEVSVAQATTVVEAPIAAEPKKSNDRAADSGASSDFAVEFQPPSNDKHPSSIAIDQNNQAKMNDTATYFEMEVSAPAASVVVDEQDSSSKETPAMVSGQAVSTITHTATLTPSFAVHPNILSGIQSQSSQRISVAMPVPHLTSPQMTSPLLATPHMAQPNVTYTPQMDAHSIIPGFQCPPAGIVHSVSVTYHISYPGQSNGQPPNPSQENVHAIHRVTDLIGQQTGRAFSPNAQEFQPHSQRDQSRRGSGNNRMRRGLGSSIFATGYSSAKHAGSFTGAPSE
ncbi:hypothetical protein CGRA01v4_11731 [Colletotrichum graminicola]|uniref:Uncharacterized protein n=1 Tax=Colletotrichum graminicola (strain M1.001 / M2 / FGSC 10212) TaxID=645133 RepID=E3QW37_COLGM|nr:uncharacterized protein GLRG_10219 [Colletotrichum graminicola M1.001]EFQ35075.1 hypothetical protein GLRG_10219 [Colletotrichum graminicola M1.001]WDK20444.1 hypothetical protein CGRA01v4_11731 [Colletotrichum graminicola]